MLTVNATNWLFVAFSDITSNIFTKKGSRGKAPGGLGKAQPKMKFSPAFFKRRWGPGAKPLARQTFFHAPPSINQNNRGAVKVILNVEKICQRIGTFVPLASITRTP